jgi:hypothetical protein
MNPEKADLVIKIKSGMSDAHVSLTGEDGIVHHKTVSIEDLVTTLMASQTLSTGILPKNTRFFCGVPGKYQIGIETIARTRDFGLFSRSRYDVGDKQKVLRIPFPPCLFVFNVSNKRVASSRVFALKNPISTEVDCLYNFPFGNTYVESGSVCWGSAKLIVVNTPMNLISMVSVFFDSAFNGDLVGRSTWRSPKEKKIRDFWSLVNYLDGKETFPSELLYKSNIKLKQLIKGA